MHSGVLSVRLIDGLSHRKEVAFTFGFAYALMSVGSARGDRGVPSWTILAPGITPRHAMLAFNGRELFACARSHGEVAIDGHPVRTRSWVIVPIGSLLTLGEATLAVAPRFVDGDEPITLSSITPADAIEQVYGSVLR
jgi:hypothetical protein